MERGQFGIFNRQSLAAAGALMAGLVLATGGCSAEQNSPDDIPTSGLSPVPTIESWPTPEAIPEPDCDKPATDGERLLCTAEDFTGVYYRWGGGHAVTITDFFNDCPNPKEPENNRPHGSDARTHNGNPSPCGVDSSGLVRVVAGKAMKREYPETVVMTLRADRNNWKRVPSRDLQPGDLAIKGYEHVAFVRHANQESNTLYTFEATRTGAPIGPTMRKLDNFDMYLRYIGEDNS